MQSILEDSREAQLAFFGHSDDNSLERELARIRHGQYDNFYAGVYFDLVLNENKRVIGSAGFHTWWRDHDRAEIGYWINNETDRGQGYMNEIMPFLLHYGFSEMKLNRIQAHTSQDNVASIALLKKYNFKKEAIIHGHYKMSDGKYSDDYLFYLLKN
jgi:[ribosomal protein S5]-alanine N-acetyltransferase